MDREVVDAMKILQQGIEGVEQRVVPIIGGTEYSDDEDQGQELFSMEAEIDPKFLRHFTTDYNYDELTPEQREVHDALFAEPDEEILVGEEGLPEGQVELDQIIKEAKGGDIKLPQLSEKDQAKRQKLVEKERAFYAAQNIPETAEEQFFRQIIGKEKKIVKFEERSESEDDDEWEDEDGEDEDNPEEGEMIEEKNEKGNKLPNKLPEKKEAEMEEPEYKPEDFPSLGQVLAEMGPGDDNEDLDEPKIDSDDEEEDKELEKKIKNEEEMEHEMRAVMKAEYEKAGSSIAKGKEEKLISKKDFDLILDSHIASMKKPAESLANGAQKKSILKKGGTAAAPQPEPSAQPKPAAKKQEPRMEVYTNELGGQVIFYYGGMKPKESKSKSVVKRGVDKVLDADDEKMKEECIRKAKEMSALQGGGEIEGVEVEEVEGDEDGEWEDEDGMEDDEEGEEEDDEDYDGEEEEDLDPDEPGISAEEKVERYINKYRFNQKLPLDMRVERDKMLPDTMLGLKVFKRTLLPDIPFSEDIAAQQVLAEEDTTDYSKPPPEYDGKSIREPLVEFAKAPNPLSRGEATEGATVVKELSKKSKHKKHFKGKGKKKEKEEKEGEDDEEDDQEQASIAQDPGLLRQKGESVEERKLRKALVKQMKEERKDKKQKFKQKYEELKKGYLSQNNAHTASSNTQGIPLYKLS